MRYRYRSPALHGPWRDDREQAIGDAIGAGQATRQEDGTLKWHDSASLEEDADGIVQQVRPTV
jgi:hypothetical protein